MAPEERSVSVPTPDGENGEGAQLDERGNSERARERAAADT